MVLELEKNHYVAFLAIINNIKLYKHLIIYDLKHSTKTAALGVNCHYMKLLYLIIVMPELRHYYIII